jgi:hypothetical protein
MGKMNSLFQGSNVSDFEVKLIILNLVGRRLGPMADLVGQDQEE